MIQPVLSNESFLANVASAPSHTGVFHLWWLGQSGYLIKWGIHHLLIDPYLSDSLTEKYHGTAKPHVRMTEKVIAPEELGFIDLVTSSHNHTDHLDHGTLKPLLEVNPGLTLVVPEANREFAAERLGIDPTVLVGLDDGQSVELSGFHLTGIASAHQENTAKLVDIFNRTVEPVVGKCRLSTHLCFGNYKGRAVAPRRYAPMFPAFLDMKVDEFHLEMAGREFAEIEFIESIAAVKDVAVGIVDVKNYYIETPEDIAERVKLCLKYVPPEKLSFALDCGLSQTARWAAKKKLVNLVGGVTAVREELGLY